jgi:hypothetical protein
VVEQGTHKPLVVGSTPTLGTFAHLVGTIIPFLSHPGVKNRDLPLPSPLSAGFFIIHSSAFLDAGNAF